jgi:hypothetical protein
LFALQKRSRTLRWRHSCLCALSSRASPPRFAVADDARDLLLLCIWPMLKAGAKT